MPSHPRVLAVAIAALHLVSFGALAQTVATLPTDADDASILDRSARLVIRQATLEDALTRLSERSGVVVAFSPSLIQTQHRLVDCECQSVTVRDALDVLLHGSTFRYAVIDGQVVLTPRGAPSLDADGPKPGATRYAGLSASVSSGTLDRRPMLIAEQTQGVVAGKVVETGTQRPLEGVQVTALGTTRGSVTDAGGHFRIAGLEGAEVTLRAQRVGYQAAERRVAVGATDIVLEMPVSAVTLDEVVTTGNVSETRIRELAFPVSVITAADIERMQISGIDELFRGTIPGVVSLEQGNIGWNTNVTVRGINSFGVQSIKTYLDGVEMANPENIAMIDPQSIERIELIRGPQAATLYGADAIGGVLQIFTKKGQATGLDRPRVTLQSTTGFVEGDYAPDDRATEQRYSVQLAGGGSDFTYNVGAAHHREGEWVKGTNDRLSSLSAGIRATEGRFTAEASLRYVTRDFSFQTFAPFLAERFPDIPTFTLPPRPLDFQQQTMGANLSYQALPNWSHNLVLGFDRAEFAFTSGFEDPAAEAGTVENRNQIKTSVRYYTTLQQPLSTNVSSTWTAGVDYWDYKTDLFSTSSAPSPDLADRIPVEEAELMLDSWSNTGYFAQGQFGFNERLFLSAAVRAEDNPNFGEDYGLAWAPRFGATYIHPFENVEAKVRAAWGEAIRPPQSAHRLGTTGGFIADIQPNTAILPEEQTGWEAGFDLVFAKRASVSATYFNQDVKNLIELVQDFDADPIFFQYQNLGKVKNKGVELEGVLDLRPVQLRTTYTRTSSRVTSLGDAYGGDLRVGDRNLDVPEYVLGGSLTYAFGRGSASVELSRIGSWTGFDVLAFYNFVFGGDPYRGSIQEYWTDYDPITKVNVQVEQALTNYLAASLRVQNITDEQRGETLSTISVAPGRAVLLGLRLTF
jgi:outer membrane receptor protein involved in Fe transport